MTPLPKGGKGEVLKFYFLFGLHKILSKKKNKEMNYSNNLQV